ncbi:MAG: serpin family protein [Candidatus Krumholzibacteriota bacterium]|nr:serpin family protein [Candidatus Krumholzibacteriota bacterium]
MSARWFLVSLVISILAGGAARAAQPTAAESGAAGDAAIAVAANAAFACDLFQRFAGEPGNLVLAPYSLSSALAMTWAGARGVTEREMAAVLRFPADQRALHDAQAALRASLERGGAAELRIANRLWGQAGLGFLPAFLTTCRERYGAGLEALDFAADPEAARRAINAWIASRTDRRIEELLLPADITIDTQLVLTNALFFRERWARPFDAEATCALPFHLADGEEAAVVTMLGQGRFAFARLDDLDLLQLPYAGGRMACVLLLPREGAGLPGLEARLAPAALDAWLAALSMEDVTVALPRFSLASRFDLGRVLAAMGMATAFGRGADFSGMTGRHDLVLDRVIHEVRLAVDEEGTEGAAATAVALKRGRTIFRADRPFLFLVRDLETGAILFLGRVADPRAS